MALTINGEYTYTKPLDTVYVNSKGDVLDLDVPSAKGTIQLPEVIVNTPNWKDMVGRYSIASNDVLRVTGLRPQNTHLNKQIEEGAARRAAWAKEHPWLETAGLIAGAAPLAVAAYPALAGAGELAYPILTNPYVDAGITSAFAGHGLNHWLNEGINGWGDAAMTALELAPLGRVAKPIYERVVQPGMRLFNSPLTGNWTTIGNRQYRLNPNSLGANGALLESRSITSQITAENASSEMSNIVRTVGDNGKIRLSLPSHTNDRPRQFVLEPQGNNKFYVHMRTWDGDHIPANLTNEEKQQLFDALYNELPEGAEILFPKSGPGYYGTRGTVAGLQRLARDPRFTPGTKGTLQYLDKDGKTVRIYEGTSFIKIPQITAENAASMTPEQWTAAQDAAIARGDMAEAQRLRDLHFKVSAPNTKVVDTKGNPQLVIHKTPNDFTVFDNSRSIGNLNWAATPKAFEGENGVFATGAGPNPKDMPLYVNMRNPHYPTIEEGMEPAFINEGEDGILGIVDKDMTDYFESSSKAGEGFNMSLGVDNPYALKSADAVTYDDNGVRIPLGKRDNFNINDIRYGLLPFLGLGTAGTLYGNLK